MDKYLKNPGSKLYACFIDLSKAFDRVWWNALYYKLLNYNINGNFYSTIKSMYNNISSSIKTNKGITPALRIFQGVRQGEVLSPMLFNLYINDLPACIQAENTDPVLIGQTNIQCLMYADDIILLSHSKQGLQNCLTNLDNYCNEWKLVVNFDKSKVIIFNRGARLLRDDFYIGQNKLECVKSYKYLGLEINNNGSFTTAVKSLQAQATKASFKLKTITSNAYLKPKVSIKLFNSLIKRIALYGADVWGYSLVKNNLCNTLSACTKSPAESTQLSFGRFILGVHKKTSNDAIRGELGLTPMGIQALICSIKYYKHVNEASLVYAAAQNLDPELHKSIPNLAQSLNVNVSDTNLLCKKLVEAYVTQWQNSVNGSSKLKTYHEFKILGNWSVCANLSNA